MIPFTIVSFQHHDGDINESVEWYKYTCSESRRMRCMTLNLANLQNYISFNVTWSCMHWNGIYGTCFFAE